MQGMQASEFLKSQASSADRILYQAEVSETPSQEAPSNPTHLPLENLLIFPIGLLAIVWVLLLLAQLDFWKSLRYQVNSVKHPHQIPCSNCQFFNKNPYLKCAVHPSKALSADAINCSDYCAKSDKP